MKPEIEKNHPPPLLTRNKYPFSRMVPGDSVFYPDQPKGGQSGPAKAAREYGNRYGQTFVAKPEDGGVRIWRLE